MPSAPPARSRRSRFSTSTNSLLPEPCVLSCVSSPMAKYASCSRAHGSQKATPLISTTAWRWQGLSVLLRTSHKTASFASVKEPPSCERQPVLSLLQLSHTAHRLATAYLGATKRTGVLLRDEQAPGPKA